MATLESFRNGKKKKPKNVLPKEDYRLLGNVEDVHGDLMRFDFPFIDSVTAYE